MREYKVYYAKMLSTPNEFVNRELKRLRDEFGEKNVFEHKKGTNYSPNDLRRSDLVFVTGYNGVHKGKGVGSQIQEALNASKPTYLLGSMQGSKACEITGLDVVDSSNWQESYYRLEVDGKTWDYLKAFNPGQSHTGIYSEQAYAKERVTAKRAVRKAAADNEDALGNYFNAD